MIILSRINTVKLHLTKDCFHVGPMPQTYKKTPDKNGYRPNGVSNRNAGLEFVLNHVNNTGDNSGVIYFADDDNTYDSNIFEEVKSIHGV